MNLKRIAFLLLLAAVLLWGIGETLLLRDERTLASAERVPNAQTSVATSSITAPSESAGTVRSTPILPTALSSSTDASPSQEREMMSVTLVLPGKRLAHRLPLGASVEALMALAREKGEIDYVAKEYAGLGALVTSIDGKKNDEGHNDMYWILSVNGKKANSGVSTFILKEGDVVSWTYEKNEYN